MSVTKAQLQRLVEDLCTLGAAVTELQLSASGALRPLGLDRNHLRSAHDGLLRAAWALNAHLGRFGAGDRNAELASWLAASQASCLEVRKRADRLVEAAISPAAPEALRPSLSELETLMAQMEESTVPLFRLAGFAFSDDLARSLADLMGVDVPPRLAEPAEPVEHAAEEPQEAEYTLCRESRELARNGKSVTLNFGSSRLLQSLPGPKDERAIGNAGLARLSSRAEPSEAAKKAANSRYHRLKEELEGAGFGDLLGFEAGSGRTPHQYWRTQDL